MTRLRILLEQALLALPLIAASVSMVYFGSLWKWDQVLYDFMLQHWQRPAPDDIVIVAVDQESLDQFGRWPWPRQLHAELIDRLHAYGSGPVALDIIFAEPDPVDPQSDLKLAAAAERHDRVVLPVVFEQTAASGLFEELLPFPALDQVSLIGHADMELDLDGIARSLYLKAGIDDPYWPALALKLLELRDPDALGELPGLTRTPSEPAAPQTLLVRDHRVWIAFAGPPGHFRRIPYRDVLNGTADADLLRDKTVLVGFTAIGQDVLPTPVSGERNPMPGVEIHANALDTLARGLWLQPLSTFWIYTLTLVCALLPLLVYPRLSPRWAAPAALVFFALPLLGGLALLIGAQLWFPPAAALLSVVLGYLLWSGRRLQTTLRYLDQELARLTREPAALPRRSEVPQLDPLMEFLRHALPVEGGVLCRPDGSVEQSWGAAIAEPPQTLPGRHGWLNTGNVWWTPLSTRDGRRRFGIRWRQDASLSAEQRELLDEIIAPYRYDRSARPVTAIEVLQERIQQVQQAGGRLREMRAFINNSMAQMADGMLVTDSGGRVLLGNPKAALYLDDDDGAELAGQFLSELFDRLEFIGPVTWRQALGDVLIEQRLAQLPARSRAGHDLLIHMAPFLDPDGDRGGSLGLGRGLIVNFADVSPLRASERRRAEMLSFLSHDLRSPLASVIALTQLARYKPEQLADGTIVDQIEERTEAILGLVDDFLQLARAESSDEIDLGEVDLVPLAEEAIEQIAPLAEARSATVVEEIDCDEAWLLGNSSLLRRLFTNLLTNAIKYSPNRAEIRLGIVCNDAEVRCWIADNGYGIAAEHLPTLFDRFQRIHRKEHKKEHGSGLGLAFVKSVVDRHHARIEVSSELNQGTTFTLHFPLIELAAARPVKAQTA